MRSSWRWTRRMKTSAHVKTSVHSSRNIGFAARFYSGSRGGKTQNTIVQKAR